MASRLAAAIPGLLLAVAAVFYALHFLHLTADFPNYSPWMDWAKYTDEGWYGDAAIRHFLSGHWYFKGDFNPAVALPVLPSVELLVFRFTGVSLLAARALTVGIFGVSLATLFALIRRFTPFAPADVTRADPTRSLAASIAVLLLCTSPFLYVFERMAILEPLLIALTLLALLAASFLAPARSFPRTSARSQLLLTLALGLLLPAMVLTKTTGVFLLPAIAYIVWARANFHLRTFLRLGLPPVLLGAALWCAYFFLFVSPRYLEDYRYLFSANAYTGMGLDPFEAILRNALTDGAWIGHVLYPSFFVLFALALFLRPQIFRSPLVPSLLLWAGGYFAFILYHNNLQPRYYLVEAFPLTALVAIALVDFRHYASRAATAAATLAIALLLLAILIPDARLQLNYVLHPTYQFESAAHAIQRIVLANPRQSHLILSISGSDLTLMTGLPSIDDDFGTLELEDRVKLYRPGWYVAWNELDDDKMDALTPLYHPQRVAAFPALDDPDRNLLILYRLDPGQPTPPPHRRLRHTPRPLRTRLGQQPSTTQLVH